QDAQRAAFLTPFQQSTGVKVVEDQPTDQAKLKAMVESGHVSWDVVDITPDYAIANCEKYLEPLDFSVIDTSQLTIKPSSKCDVPVMSGAIVLAYNKNKYGANPPQSWADFFDTKRFPGKRAIGTNPRPSATLEAALLGAGVAPDRLYPLDIDAALRELDKIRPDTLFWSTSAELQQMLESGRADMAVAYNGRAYEAA